MTRETAPKSENEPTVEPKAPEAMKPTELEDRDLDPASGGAWPYLTTSYSSGGLKGG